MLCRVVQYVYGHHVSRLCVKCNNPIPFLVFVPSKLDDRLQCENANIVWKTMLRIKLWKQINFVDDYNCRIKFHLQMSDAQISFSVTVKVAVFVYCM